MTTADPPLMNRRHRQQQTGGDSRPSATSSDELAPERQHLLFSLKTIGWVALTLLFLRLGIPGAAFVSLVVTVLLLSTGHRGKPEGT